MDLAAVIEQQPGTVLFVEYDPSSGRVLSSGCMFQEDMELTLTYTARRLLAGEGRPETHYVDLAGRDPALTPRPALGRGFDKTAVAVREAATMADLPAALVTFDGPLKGVHQHPGGDLVAGWTVPGTYTVTVEAFPCLPATFDMIVGAAA